MRKINNIKLFSNDNEKSMMIACEVKKQIEKYNFNLSDDNYDLALAIGGDGSFLRMIKANNFNSNIYYVGINAGTLGFLQEIKPDEIGAFFEKLNDNEFKTDEISIEETVVTNNKGKVSFFSLNEIVIRDRNLNTLKLKIKIDNHMLEDFVGDGVLISTPVGSTAYNLSFGGSIIYNSYHCLQITPIAPLNTKCYRNLINSVIIPDDKVIQMIPESKSIIISIDGENSIYNNVSLIETSVRNKKIKCLRLNDYNFLKIVHEKLLK